MIVIDEEAATGTVYSRPFETDRNGYSVQIDFTGAFEVNIELQASLNKTKWITVSEPVSSVLLGVTNADGESVLYDQELNKHRFIRLKIDVIVGSPKIIGAVSR